MPITFSQSQRWHLQMSCFVWRFAICHVFLRKYPKPKINQNSYQWILCPATNCCSFKFVSHQVTHEYMFMLQKYKFLPFFYSIFEQTKLQQMCHCKQASMFWWPQHSKNLCKMPQLVIKMWCSGMPPSWGFTYFTKQSLSGMLLYALELLLSNPPPPFTFNKSDCAAEQTQDKGRENEAGLLAVSWKYLNKTQLVITAHSQA